VPVAEAQDGASLAYRTRGTGSRNVLLLHAWGASGNYFDEMVDHLDLSAVRAIALDLRGHGDSNKADVDLTWDVLGGDVFSVADAAGAGSFVVVGHSMGGKLAQYLPLIEPSRVQALVLVASPSAGKLAPPAAVAEWVEFAGDAQALVDKTVRPYIHAPVPESVLRRFGEDAAKIPRVFLEKTMDLVKSTSFIERLDAIHMPVLIVTGSRDPLHSAAAAAVSASFPHARIETLDCGGEIPMEMPSELASLTKSFLAGLP
jgi:pimeloyl-ACP methyl ester carboxylesterase